MKNPELYHKTIGILVKAYLNDTLEQSQCYACAVGNIINHYKPFTDQEKKDLRFHNNGWVLAFCTFSHKEQRINLDAYKGKAKEQIDITGYSIYELAKVEYAFESSYNNECNDDDNMLNGLMAVVEVLGQIHECDKETIEESKLMFVKC